MSYTVLKTIHLFCAFTTYVLFFVRGAWLINNSRQLSLPGIGVIPHVVDSILLLSAIGLVVLTNQYPGEQAWLNAKLIALVVYILLGISAFRLCRKRTTKLVAWLLAQLVFFYIVFVALTRTIYPT